MRKFGIILLLLLYTFCSNAQEYFKEGTFVLKGKVKNPTQPFFEFALTTFLGDQTHSVPLGTDFSFEKSFPIQHRQRMTIWIEEDDVQLLVEQGDTLTLNWDDKQMRNTFSVRATGEFRNRDLQLEYKLDTSFRQEVEKLEEYLAASSRLVSLDERSEKVNEVFNRHLQALLGQGPFTRHQINLATGLYYQYSHLLYNNQLLPQYKLQPRIDSAFRWSIDIAKRGHNYNQLNEHWFQDVPQYREFIYNYVRLFPNPFDGWQSLVGTQRKKSNPILDQYHRAQSAFTLLPIRDWFLAKIIIYGFQHHPFLEVEEVYQRVISEIGSPYLKDTLEKHYAVISQLGPGKPAPDFTLKDNNGKMVRLSDFRGKVVYMNWWGVGCGPCLYEIQNHEGDLHQQFKGKDVVFLNICVDSEEKEWKAALKKYKLDGVNLIALGWVDNTACKAYNIDGIPHYVLIDKKGKIVNYKAPRPSELKYQGENNELKHTLDSKDM